MRVLWTCLIATSAQILFGTSVLVARDWKYDLRGQVTRCFQVDEVKARCEEGSELDLSAQDRMGVHYSYGYGRAIEGTLCGEHVQKIKQLLTGAGQVCITGVDEVTVSGNEVYSKWKSIETSRGMVSW